VRLDRKRARHVLRTLRAGPTEAGYAFFRARRRRRNVADEEPELTPSDRLVLNPDADLDPEDLAANAEVLSSYADAPELEVRSVQWFLPFFHLATGGGVHTVLRLADHLAREHGVHNRFCLYDRDDQETARAMAAKLAGAFPALAGAPVTAAGQPLDGCDAAVATAWSSLFPLVRYRGARAKFFLVQDWEPDFYPAGAARALLEEAARLEIPGIVNSPGLARSYRACGSPAVDFVPAVDTSLYRPSEGPRDPASPVRVFFYGRPSVPRNAFGLGLAALRRVKQRCGRRVEIVCAGEDWSPGQYGAAGVLSNHGMLEDLQAVAELYRSCDVGLVFMFTRHPSYQPLEFMASGMVTVSNRNPHTAWLLRHGRNSLLAGPLPALVAEQLCRAVDDEALRAGLAQAGLATARATSWPQQLERVWGAITKRGEASFE
jgi:O-antigen biosynthesis protein